MKIETLQNEMIKAMKDKKGNRKTVISDIVATAKNMAIEAGCKDNITEEIVDKAILKSKKMCQEQIDTCPAERADVLAVYKENMEIINEFAPVMMSEDEVRKAVYNIIATTDIQQTGKGAIMKAVMPKLKGKAEGKVINQIVDEICKKTGE